jgi:hypothetical protein
MTREIGAAHPTSPQDSVSLIIIDDNIPLGISWLIINIIKMQDQNVKSKNDKVNN